MKLISAKNLLASLLGMAFVLYKVMTFDELFDLYWICFIGYLSIKGLIAAFSQKAYDEDIQTATQKKALYLRLFGKFAYIAVDIPIIVILLTGLLAILSPASKALGAVFIVLLLLALGYMLWLIWYITKHKRLLMERGQWGTLVLSPEDEQAWKCSGIWHCVLYGVILVLGIAYSYLYL